MNLRYHIDSLRSLAQEDDLSEGRFGKAITALGIAGSMLGAPRMTDPGAAHKTSVSSEAPGVSKGSGRPASSLRFVTMPPKAKQKKICRTNSCTIQFGS